MRGSWETSTGSRVAPFSYQGELYRLVYPYAVIYKYNRKEDRWRDTGIPNEISDAVELWRKSNIELTLEEFITKAFNV